MSIENLGCYDGDDFILGRNDCKNYKKLSTTCLFQIIKMQSVLLKPFENQLILYQYNKISREKEKFKQNCSIILH